MSGRHIAADTDALRKGGLSQFEAFTAEMKSIAADLKAALDGQDPVVPEERGETDISTKKTLKDGWESAHKLMDALTGLVDGGAAGIERMSSMFEKVEDSNEEQAADLDLPFHKH